MQTRMREVAKTNAGPASGFGAFQPVLPPMEAGKSGLACVQCRYPRFRNECLLNEPLFDLVCRKTRPRVPFHALPAATSYRIASTGRAGAVRTIPIRASGATEPSRMLARAWLAELGGFGNAWYTSASMRTPCLSRLKDDGGPLEMGYGSSPASQPGAWFPGARSQDLAF